MTTTPRTLRELERRLAIDDAVFVQQFDAAPAPVPAVAVQMFGGLVLGLLMLLAGSMAGAVAFLGAAAATGLLWWYAHDPEAAALRAARGRPAGG